MKIISKIIVGLLVVSNITGQPVYAAEGKAKFEPKGFMHTANNFLKNSQRFMVGFIIGATHGTVNKVAENRLFAEGQYMRRNAVHSATFAGATYIAHKYQPLLGGRPQVEQSIVKKNGRIRETTRVIIKSAYTPNEDSKLVWFGRGVGQAIVEAAVDSCANDGFKAPKINVSLLVSGLWYSWDYLTSK